MRLYILLSILSFGFGLFVSLFAYIKLEWVILVILLIGFLVKVLVEASPFSGSQIKSGLGLVLPYVMKLANPKSDTSNNVTIKNNRMIIEFDHKGKKRRHILPYNRKELSKHSRHTVHLIDENNQEIELLHIPGVTFTHTAQELGGKIFKVTNKLTQEIKFYENELPKF